MTPSDLERQPPLILVVDDEKLTRLLERSALEQAGFVVEEAQNGAMALSAFERLKPDAVLLDVMMPELDGFFRLCTDAKATRGDLTPIFIVTGLDDLESISRAYEVGATDFIAKPINWGVLGHHVRYMLRAARGLLRLKLSEAKNQALLNAIPDLMFRINKEGIFLEAKGSKEVVYSLPPQEFVGKRLDEVLPRDVAQKTSSHVTRAFQTGETQLFVYELQTGDSTHYYEARIVVSGEEEVLAIVRDVTERIRAEEQILRLAYYDSLTGLPNRLLFKDRLSQAMANAQRYGRKVAVMFLDLDHFKRINDTLGHNFWGFAVAKGW